MPAPPIPLSGMAALKVAISVVAVLFEAPGAAPPDQLLMLVQELSTGAADQVWLEPEAEAAADNTARTTVAARRDRQCGKALDGVLVFMFVVGAVSLRVAAISGQGRPKPPSAN